MTTIIYVLILSAIFAGIIIGGGVYLWLNYKREKKYNTEALPSIEDLKPEDLIIVSTYSKDTTSLPSIDEIEEESLPPVSDFLSQSSRNPFDF